MSDEGYRVSLKALSGCWLVIALTAAALRAAPASLPEVAPSAELEQQLLEVAGEGFRIHRTAHFAIAYDTPFETVQLLQGRLEGTFGAVYRWSHRLELVTAPLTQPMGVVLFAKPEGFDAACRRVGISSASVGGFYSHKTNLSFFLDAAAAPTFEAVNARLAEIQQQIEAVRAAGRSSPELARLLRESNSLRHQRDAAVERFNRLIIQHEAAHQLLHNLGVHPRGVELPDWLVEGLACNFESSQLASGRGKPAVNPMRLADFRQACGATADRGGKPVQPEVAEAALATALGAGRFMPLDLLCSGRPIADGHTEAGFRYAQAWSLVFFLLREDEARFAAYVKATSQRRPGGDPQDERALFEAHFGRPDAEFARRWMQAVLSQPVPRE